MKPGSIYSPRIVDNEIKKIENKIRELNIDFILVVPKIVRNEENKTLNINFSFEKSSPNYVDRINIAGNKVTKEYYINDYGNQIKNFVESVYLRIREIKLHEKFSFKKNLYPGLYIIEIAKKILNKNKEKNFDEFSFLFGENITG